MLCYELEIAYEKSEITGKELEWGNPKRDAMEKLNAVLFAQKDEKDFKKFLINSFPCCTLPRKEKKS